MWAQVACHMHPACTFITVIYPPDSCMSPLPHCILSRDRSISTLSAAVLAVKPCTDSANGHTMPEGVCGEPIPLRWEPSKKKGFLLLKMR